MLYCKLSAQKINIIGLLCAKWQGLVYLMTCEKRSMRVKYVEFNKNKKEKSNMFFERIILKRRLASNDAAVRLQAIDALDCENDRTILLQLAGSDCDSDVRCAAIRRFSEPDILQTLRCREQDPMVLELLASRIDELYGEMALRASAAGMECDAFDRIENAETIISVALRSKSPNLVLAAGARLAARQDRWLQLVEQLNDDKLALELYQRNMPDPESPTAAYLLTAARSRALRNAIAAEAASCQHAAQCYAREQQLVEIAEHCADSLDVRGFEDAIRQYRELEKHHDELQERLLAARYRFYRAQEEALASKRAEERNRQLAENLLRQLEEHASSGNWKLILQTIESWKRCKLDQICGNTAYAESFNILAQQLLEKYQLEQQQLALAMQCAERVLNEFRKFERTAPVPPPEERQMLLNELENSVANAALNNTELLAMHEQIYNCERELRRRARQEAQARDISRWEHYTLKMDICAALEKLAKVDDNQLGAAAREFRTLRERWNSIGAVPNEKFEELRTRYHEVCSALHSRLEKFFAEREESFQQARDVKEKLLAEAESLSGSDDWSQTSSRLKELQNLWKAAGSAGVTVDRELFKRFHDACDAFFVRRNAAWEEQKKQYIQAARRKQELCKAVEDLKNTPFPQAKKEIALLREQWKNTPSAGKDDRLLYLEFNRLIEGIFSAHREAGDAERRQAEILCTDLNEVLEKARSGSVAIRDVEKLKQDNEERWKNLPFRPATDIVRRRDRIAEELQTVLCGLHHSEAMHKLESAEQLEAVIDPGMDEAKLIEQLGRRLKVCGELEERLRECRIISGGGDLASELQQAFAGNFGDGEFRLTIAELDEFLRRFVAVGHVPPDAREAVFERFRTLYNRALTELQREENEKTLKSE